MVCHGGILSNIELESTAVDTIGKREPAGLARRADTTLFYRTLVVEAKRKVVWSLSEGGCQCGVGSA